MSGIMMIYIGIGCIAVSLIGLLITAIVFPSSRRKQIARVTDMQ